MPKSKRKTARGDNKASQPSAVEAALPKTVPLPISDESNQRTSSSARGPNSTPSNALPPPLTDALASTTSSLILATSNTPTKPVNDNSTNHSQAMTSPVVETPRIIVPPNLERQNAFSQPQASPSSVPSRQLLRPRPEGASESSADSSGSESSAPAPVMGRVIIYPEITRKPGQPLRRSHTYIVPKRPADFAGPHIPRSRWTEAMGSIINRKHRAAHELPWTNLPPRESTKAKKMQDAYTRLERFYDKARRRVIGEFEPESDDEDYLAEPETMKIMEWAHRTNMRREQNKVEKDEEYLYSSDSTDVEQKDPGDPSNTTTVKRPHQKSDLFWQLYRHYTMHDTYSFYGKIPGLQRQENIVQPPLSDEDEDPKDDRPDKFAWKRGVGRDMKDKYFAWHRNEIEPNLHHAEALKNFNVIYSHYQQAPPPEDLPSISAKKVRHALNRAKKLAEELEGTRPEGALSDSDSEPLMTRPRNAQKRVRQRAYEVNKNREPVDNATKKRQRVDEGDIDTGSSSKRKKLYEVAFAANLSDGTFRKRSHDESEDDQGSSEDEENRDSSPPKRIRYVSPKNRLSHKTPEGRARRTGNARARYEFAKAHPIKRTKADEALDPLPSDDPEEFAGDGGNSEFSSSDGEAPLPPVPDVARSPVDTGFPAEPFPDPKDEYSEEENGVEDRAGAVAKSNALSSSPKNSFIMELPPLPDFLTVKEQHPVDPITFAMNAIHDRRKYLEKVLNEVAEDARIAIAELLLAEKEAETLYQTDLKLFDMIGRIDGREAVEVIANKAEARIDYDGADSDGGVEDADADNQNGSNDEEGGKNDGLEQEGQGCL